LKLEVPTTALPTSNSVYSAPTIGPDQTIWTSTFGGLTRFRQCAPDETSERLDPVQALLGRFPTGDPQEGLLRSIFGLPN
jgi:hypothetical protein